MKNLLSFIVVLMVSVFLLPASFLAENSEESTDSNSEPKENTEAVTEETEKQYNEFGIEIGTMVHGEDISKLSEEELQYIPEGWRDGVIESEHHEEPQKRSMMSRATVQSYPDVNSYIQSNNLSTARIEYDHKDFFTRFNYRYGFGKVEGVVAHETANSNSTITGEIAFMSTNHKNAFVHAFVDHNRIIEIHPPELGAWGGGRYANQRYVHVELVRVHSFADFAKSINNYSDYIASLLYKYNLGLDNADPDGEGTLWSHRAVTNHLGGTTHVDPHGYFASWGYEWNDFVALVTKKLNASIAEKEEYTSKLGHIKSDDVRIYQDPYQQSKYTRAGNNYTDEVYYIKQEYKLNGTLYYLLSRQASNREGTIGWVKASDLNVHNHEKQKNKGDVKDLIVIGNAQAFNKPWGGSKNIVINDLSASNGAAFQVENVEKVGSNSWYQGTVNGKLVWAHSSSFAKESSTSELGHIRNGDVKIYPQLGNSNTAFTAKTVYTNAVFYIKKEAKVNGEQYQLISKNPSSTTGVIGWVKADDMMLHAHKGKDKDSKTLYLTGNGSAFDKAWGGTQDLVYENLSEYRNQQFKVNLTETVGRNIWYRGTLNGKTIWVHSSQASAAKESSTSKLGHIRSGDVKIYPVLGNESTAFAAGTEYTDAVYYIKKEALINGQWYRLLSNNPSSSSGVVGWTKAGDLSVHDHKGKDKDQKLFYIKGTGSAFDKAWGGSKNLVYNELGSYKKQEFKVHLTETVGNNTWYRGELDNKTVWLHSSQVLDIEKSGTSKLGHIRNDQVKIYPEIGNSSTAFVAGSDYTNAVYYIKEQAVMNDQRYYLLSKNPSSTSGVVGWVKESDLSTHDHKGLDRKAKTFYLKGTGSAFSKAWGGAQDVIYGNLANYKDKQFNVHLTETVGSNVWYRGTLYGKTVWIHNAFVK